MKDRVCINEIKENFEIGKYFKVTGRVIAKRIIGKIIFLNLRDQSGSIQLICNRNVYDERLFSIITAVKTGDIISAEGETCFSNTNEKSLLLKSCSILRRNQTINFIGYKKTQRKNQYKERYLELSVNQGKFKYYTDCSRLIFRIRESLYNRGFLEFDTGILQSCFEGGLVKPFETYSRAICKNFYLRAALEIKLKQLLASGYEKIFEIGRVFRNVGFNSQTSPEFILLECYQAFSDYHDMINLVETVIKEALLKIFGEKVDAQTDRMASLLKPWKKINFAEIMQEKINKEISSFRNKNNLKKILSEHGLTTATGATEGQMIRKILEKLIISKITFPTFITEIPLTAFPLAKTFSKNEEISEGAILVIDGEFVGDIYTDENDPEIIKDRLIEQTKKVGRPVNENFINLLRFGVPPSAGFGLGINRLLLVVRDDWEKDIRETFVFPPLS